MSSPLVSLREVGIAHRRDGEVVHALRGVTMTMAAGEMVAVVGPSGSGKTSLLGVLGGWEIPDAGRVLRTGGDRGGDEPAWNEVAAVPQTLGLLAELTIEENVVLPLRLSGIRTGRAAVDPWLERLGLTEVRDRLPGATSLGQQQRAAVARALVVSPRLVVADEPTAHLDAKASDAVLAALREVVTDGASCLIATHDPAVMGWADRVLRMVDGRLVGNGPAAPG